MNDSAIKAISSILILVIVTIIGLLIAFPIKWCWNYAVVYVWDLPVITWGQAYCMYLLTNLMIKSYLINTK